MPEPLGIHVSFDRVLEKTQVKWRTAEQNNLLLEAKLEELLEENEKLRKERDELKDQIDEMITAQQNGRSKKELPEDALKNEARK